MGGHVLRKQLCCRKGGEHRKYATMNGPQSRMPVINHWARSIQDRKTKADDAGATAQGEIYTQAVNGFPSQQPCPMGKDGTSPRGGGSRLLAGEQRSDQMESSQRAAVFRKPGHAREIGGSGRTAHVCTAHHVAAGSWNGFYGCHCFQAFRACHDQSNARRSKEPHQRPNEGCRTGCKCTSGYLAPDRCRHSFWD